MSFIVDMSSLQLSSTGQDTHTGCQGANTSYY